MKKKKQKIELSFICFAVLYTLPFCFFGFLDKKWLSFSLGAIGALWIIIITITIIINFGKKTKNAKLPKAGR